MTHPGLPPILPEDTDLIDPSLRRGAQVRCYSAIYRHTAALGALSGYEREDVLSNQALKTMAAISRVTTRGELLDLVINFVGDTEILDDKEGIIDTDPDVQALDQAIRDHIANTQRQPRRSQVPRALRNSSIDASNHKGARTEAMSYFKNGLTTGNSVSDAENMNTSNVDKQDDVFTATGEAALSHRASADNAYFSNVAVPHARAAVELIRAIYLPVLLNRGHNARNSGARTWIKHFDMTAIWLRATGQSSNEYVRTHDGVSRAEPTRARQRLSEALRVCIYADDLLCPARTPYDPASQPWPSAVHDATEDPSTVLAALLSPPMETGTSSQGLVVSDTSAPTATEPLVGNLGHPRCTHLDTCLDVIDRIDSGKTLTVGESRVLRLAAMAVTTTEDAGTRADANRFVLLALDLDPGIRKELKGFRELLKALKPRAVSYLEARLDGQALDAHSFGDVITTLFGGQGDADILKGVSPRSRVRAARLVAVRTGRPDPSPEALSIDPQDQAIRLVEDLHRSRPTPSSGRATESDPVLTQITGLVTDHGTTSERSDIDSFLAMATDPASTKVTVNRLQKMIVARQTAELKGIIVTAVNCRIDDALRDRFHTSGNKPAVIERLHDAETLYAYWAHTSFAPDDPLAFNCVRPGDHHNPTPDRNAEITL